MSITLDGTQGITNDATDLNYTGTLTGGTGVVNLGSGQFYKDASGNVGIGTSSPSSKLTVVEGGATFQSVDANGYARFTQNGANAQLGLFRSGSAVGGGYIGANSDASLIVMNSAFTERMRIDSSGNLLVGTTSALQSGSANFVTPSDGTLVLRCSSATSGNYYRVGHDSASAFIIYNQASVGVYLNPGATSWSANSDERVKDIIEPIADAAEKVSSLRAVIGKYKNDEEGTRRAFLIAQDVQAVLPEAVNQQNDEIGTLGVQYTDVIPLLVAAIKELKAELDTVKAANESLTARIEALENQT